MSIQRALAKSTIEDFTLTGSRVVVLEPLSYRITSSQSHSSTASFNERLTILPGISDGAIHHPEMPATLHYYHGNTGSRSNFIIADKTYDLQRISEGSNKGGICSDADVINHALRFERFQVSTQEEMKESQVPSRSISMCSETNLQRTWHSELSKNSDISQGPGSSNQSELVRQMSSSSIDSAGHQSIIMSTVASTESSQKHVRYRKKLRKKSAGRSKGKTKPKSAPRTKELINSNLSSNNNHGNQTVKGAQCHVMNRRPSASKSSKPNISMFPVLKSYIGTKQSNVHNFKGPEDQDGAHVSRSNAVITNQTTVVNRGDISRSFSQDNNVMNTYVQSPQRVVKVFCSDKQSTNIHELGLDRPAAPPVTPMPEMLSRFEYVPSMNDVRSQRAVKVRLDALSKVEKIRKQKIAEEKLRQDKLLLKGLEIEHKKQQRLQIYALNKIMTEFENTNFQEFCRKNGINTT